jgi:serine/threonine-protein kinase
MASTSRLAQSQPRAADAGSSGPEAVVPPGAGTDRILPRTDDPVTIISNRPPMPVESLFDSSSDSAIRILQGRIEPGDHLGHFDLVQYVGGGGMGRVFRALDTRLARTVAVKVLSPDQAADRDTLLRFQNEAQSAARLDHENIARVYYVGEDRGLHFIVFEFIEGVNVRELVEAKGPLPLGEAIRYTLQTAEALAHAARRNVVHRDIKPSNLLITTEGQVKLIDMGLARLRELNSAAVDLTASGVTLGTFDYISPEQARDPRNADVRSDLYSLGCTFFYMLAGRPPFPQGTVLQKLLQHQGDQPPDVRQFRPDLPDGVSRILRRTLAKDPRHRYCNPTEMVADLWTLAQEAGIHPWGLAGPTRAVPRRPSHSFLHRHLPWLLPLSALVSIVLLLDYFWSPPVGQDRPFPPPSLTEGEEESVSQSSGAKPVVTAPARTAPSRAANKPAKEHGDGMPARPPSSPGPGPGAAPGGNTVRDAHNEPLFMADAHDAGAASRDVGAASQDVDAARLRWPAADEDLDSAKFNPLQPLLPDALRHPGGDASDAAWGGMPLGGPTSLPGLGGTSAGEAYGGKLTVVAGPTLELPGFKPAGEFPPQHAGLLIVGDPRPEIGGHDDNQFSTLAAACSAAVNGDVIELRFNGPREEKPLQLGNLHVTIRAGEGYRPALVFRPTESDPLKSRRAMLSAAAGRLTLINVALQLQVPRETPADSWSLLETHGEQMVRLEKCVLTIQNASEQLGTYHQDVAFVRVKSAPGANTVLDDSGTATPAANIELVDCIVRGEAVFLLAEDLQPLRLAWDNGLLATTERLLSTSGGARTPQPGESLQLDLRHVTALVRSGLCRMAGSQGDPHQLPLQLACTDSILVGGSGNALLEQIGAGDVEDFRQRITWNGDRNCYDGFEVFWSIRGLDSEAPPELMAFEAWRAHWGPEHENLPRLGRVNWRKLPAADRAVHRFTPADFALSEAAGNPAVGAASDGRNIGLEADRLPAPPLQLAPAGEASSATESSSSGPQPN